MVHNIVHNNKVLAIIIRSDYQKQGLEFFTPPEFSQQLAYMKHPKGHMIAPHVHNIVSRTVELTQEVILLRRGKVRVDLYDDNKNYVTSANLQPGDLILLAHGGHGFEMLEDAEMIEVKQGPYCAEMDKVKFDPIAKEHVRYEIDSGK